MPGLPAWAAQWRPHQSAFGAQYRAYYPTQWFRYDKAEITLEFMGGQWKLVIWGPNWVANSDRPVIVTGTSEELLAAATLYLLTGEVHE